MKLLLLILAIAAPACKSVTDWRPVLQPDIFTSYKGQFQSEPNFAHLPGIVAQSYQPSLLQSGGHCEIHKVGFTQDLYFQYIQYKVNIPKLKEFTICHWSKFNNHTNDHPIFSYALDGQPRAIYAWVANTQRSSYFSLAVEGHTLYRLNYPLRLNRWYHTCQSWNGRTGEWQIWVNAERVGRGFHNRLVGNQILPGGIAITGQEQTQTGGGFSEGIDAPKGSGGMLGEVTMVQLYSVALTAGKAHRDHKHHHAHTFDHNGLPITTTPRPPTPPRPQTPTHPLLTGGQLNPNIALSIASGQPQPLFGQGQPQSLLDQPQQLIGQPQQLIGQPQFGTDELFGSQFLTGQFGNTLIPQQMSNTPQSRGPQLFAGTPIAGQQPQSINVPQQELTLLLSQQQQQPSQPADAPPQFDGQPLINGGLVHPSLVNPANVQFIDAPLETHDIFKRDNENSTGSDNLTKNDKKKVTTKSGKDQVRFGSKLPKSAEDTTESLKQTTEKKQTKRELYLQGDRIIDDGSFSNVYDKSFLDGLASIGQNQPILQQQKQNDDREPAEAEVKAVMNICSGCDQEPFGKALVFGWRKVTKKLYSGAFYTPAVPQCKAF